MANIKIEDLNIDAFKVGAADCSIYLGTDKLYQQGVTESDLHKVVKESVDKVI